ncbi:MAG TPA: PilX N-terminal domain-containing pilus assembly protein [Steroidobacteraceae bacterium]|jgi:type IV pilus assembly protein PilX
MKPINMRSEFRIGARQRGAILIVSLILLLIMTILALTVSQTSRMQERMAGNSRDSDLSFQAAEAGLRDAENFLWTQTSQPIACGTPPCVVYQKDALSTVNLTIQNQDWWDTNGKEYGVAGSHELNQAKRDPSVVIEELGFTPYSLTVGKGVPGGRTFYRNTARGVGGTDAAQTVVESTFTRPY